jgi:hypothetical protein
MLAPDTSILDGRNRYLACLKAKVQPIFDHYEGDESKMVAYVVSKNMKRRHLNEGQRGMVAAALETLSHGGDRKSKDQKVYRPLDRKSAATLLNISVPTVKRAARVRKKGSPELIAAVERGEISVTGE